MILGHIEFGGLEILPPAYVNTCNIDYSGDMEDYRVLHFVDVDDGDSYIVYYGQGRKGDGDDFMRFSLKVDNDELPRNCRGTGIWPKTILS